VGSNFEIEGLCSVELFPHEVREPSSHSSNAQFAAFLERLWSFADRNTLDLTDMGYGIYQIHVRPPVLVTAVRPRSPSDNAPLYDTKYVLNGKASAFESKLIEVEVMFPNLEQKIAPLWSRLPLTVKDVIVALTMVQKVPSVEAPVSVLGAFVESFPGGWFQIYTAQEVMRNFGIARPGIIGSLFSNRGKLEAKVEKTLYNLEEEIMQLRELGIEAFGSFARSFLVKNKIEEQLGNHPEYVGKTLSWALDHMDVRKVPVGRLTRDLV